MKKPVIFFSISVIWMIGWIVGAYFSEQLGALVGVVTVLWCFIYAGTIWWICETDD